MRVLYFTRDYTPHDYRFLAALAKTKHTVYFLQLERRGHQLEDRPLPVEIERILWKGGDRPFGWLDIPRLLGDFRRIVHALKPDLIHAGPVQTSAFIAALSGYHPLVSMSWGYDLMQDADQSAWMGWITRYVFSRTQVMIGDCDAVRQKACSYGMKDEHIITFPWGIDLEHFSPQDTLANGDFTLLSVRSWEPVYGVDLIARAFSRLAPEYPEMRLLMLGNGSQASLLRRIFAQAGVEDRVFMPGQAGYNDLPRYYRSADLYISASHTDGSSISLLEAMACGKPALVSDIPGNQEWISPGKTGWMFRDGDVDSLVGGIRKVMEERQRLVEMGQASRHVAEQRANWDRNFQKLLFGYELAIREIGR